MSSDAQLLQQLPSVSKILENNSIQALIRNYSRAFVVDGIQQYLAELRDQIQNGQLSEKALSEKLSVLDTVLHTRLRKQLSPSLHQVVNACGVILHTNFGRAPLSPGAAEAIAKIASSYSNLEYNLNEGQRGHRDLHFEDRIRGLLGCEASTVCNNNAAAVLLIINTFALGKKVLVSRGELVEIGGSFRIPAILERSGAILKEVGTTNKTKTEDYREAIDDSTGLILRVHPSNYKVVGFTHQAPLVELVALAREHRIPVANDIGSGLLFPSTHDWLRDEPSVTSVLGEGVDLISFSGDKLLGGPQAGIIAGKKLLVDTIRRNPLMRACRVDKMAYASLEWTLMQYEQGTYQESIPVHQMLTAPAEIIKARAESLRNRCDRSTYNIEIQAGHSVIGGGSAPEEKIPTYLLAVTSHNFSVNEMERRLREFAVPVIARIEEDKLLFDLRTVFPEQEELIASALAEIVRQPEEKTQ